MSKSKTNNTNKTNKTNKTKKRHNIRVFLDNCLDNMKQKQEEMLIKYNFGRKDNKFIFFPYKKKFYMFNDKKKEAFFEGQFQIIGTYSPKSETWRFGWANRYIPNDLKKTSLRIKEFGESNGFNIFSEPKIKDDKLGLVFTAIGMKLSNAKGYYIIPADGKFPEVFIIFTKVRKIKKSINKIIKDTDKNSITKKMRYEKMLGVGYKV
jgi:hypothetical protein